MQNISNYYNLHNCVLFAFDEGGNLRHQGSIGLLVLWQLFSALNPTSQLGVFRCIHITEENLCT